jgi:hypothetical protein
MNLHEEHAESLDSRQRERERERDGDVIYDKLAAPV